MESEEARDQIILFLKRIGIPIILKELENTTFLPGIDLTSKGLIIDFTKLLYPGDLLHEAGHYAVCSKESRDKIGTPLQASDWPCQGEEIGAMLWSFAAADYLKIPLEIVFHEKGYKGNANWLIDSYKEGNYIGLPFLEWCGLSLSPESAFSNNQLPFPHMIQWIRDAN